VLRAGILMDIGRARNVCAAADSSPGTRFRATIAARSREDWTLAGP
jgi:hypothetical protein